MPPALALTLTLAFVAVLFYRDLREKPPVTPALWLPIAWVLLIASRPVSQWLSLTTSIDLPDIDPYEGSPVDRAVILVLMAAGVAVLHARRVSVATVVSRHAFLAIFLVYCALAVLWSDVPFVAFKRWIKILGHPIMALIVMTEPDPREATVRLFKRCAYVLVPLSITFIKYFPAIGRGFEQWTGMAYNTGVTSHKNGLGLICLVFGLFFAFHLLTIRGSRPGPRRAELVLGVLFLGMTAWLLRHANSATALAALVVGCAVLLVLGTRFIDRRRVATYLVAGLVLAMTAEMLFSVSHVVIRALGRDPTLTGRVELWGAVLRADINPIIGAGFETFWIGEAGRRLQLYWRESGHAWTPGQAHNGYLEIYLTLGWVGLLLLGAWLLETFRSAQTLLLRDLDTGRFHLAIFVVVLLYNFTEASFRSLSLMWFLCFFIATQPPLATGAQRVGVPVRYTGRTGVSRTPPPRPLPGDTTRRRIPPGHGVQR